MNQTVIAVKQITEVGFAVDGQMHVHAEPGDRGDVVHVDADGARTVRFQPSGTATIVEPEEVEAQIS